MYFLQLKNKQLKNFHIEEKNLMISFNFFVFILLFSYLLKMDDILIMYSYVTN